MHGPSGDLDEAIFCAPRRLGRRNRIRHPLGSARRMQRGIRGFRDRVVPDDANQLPVTPS
jgi:hypothetical protein